NSRSKAPLLSSSSDFSAPRQPPRQHAETAMFVTSIECDSLGGPEPDTSSRTPRAKLRDTTTHTRNPHAQRVSSQVPSRPFDIHPCNKILKYISWEKGA